MLGKLKELRVHDFCRGMDAMSHRGQSDDGTIPPKLRWGIND